VSGVLVTGATTPIGHALLRALLDDPDCERVLAVGAEAEPATLPGYGSGRVVYERADLTRPREVRRLLFGPARELGIESVLHTALHRSAIDEGGRVRALNVESTRQLLYLAERHPTLRRFVLRSYGDVYRIDPGRPVLISEEHPLDFSSGAPQFVRDRREADITVCTRMGLSPVRIIVLRCAEILAPASGSQLYDYLSAPVCFRPLGFNPMLNLMTIEDAVDAMVLALRSEADGVFNIPGADTLPLSEVVREWGRRGLAVPGPLLAPLYRVRATALGMEFRYDLNHRRFHFSAVLDGTRAREVLGYVPSHPIAWPSGGAAVLERAEPRSKPEAAE
jgi:UDP-glucose 4-epimerase